MGPVVARSTEQLISLVELLGNLPAASLLTPAISLIMVWCYFGILLLIASTSSLRIAWRWIAIPAGFFFILIIWHIQPVSPRDTLRLDVLAVGNGMVCVLQLPDGQTLLYDLGCTPPRDITRYTLHPFLAKRHIHSIDTVALSHPNLDHFSGIPDLIAQYSVGSIITTDHFDRLASKNTSAQRLKAEVADLAIPWHHVMRGDRLSTGENVCIDVLWPPSSTATEIEEANDSSLVLRIAYARKRILLTGDIEETAQQQLLASEDVSADVLVLPHHGGVTSTTAAFIEAVDPDYCIRSSRQRNDQTTNGLLDLVQGHVFFNTADDGAVSVQISPSELTVQSFLTSNNGDQASACATRPFLTSRKQ
jgi:competence protein ComEC